MTDTPLACARRAVRDALWRTRLAVPVGRACGQRYRTAALACGLDRALRRYRRIQSAAARAR